MEFRMPKGSEKLSYFGCGPTETYQDKRQSGRMGIYKTTVTDHFEPYIRPQENMAHTDTRWARVTNEAGQGIKLLATEDCKSFSFNCAHFSVQQLTEAQHDYELTPLEETVVNIDLLQAGIGSNSCGPVLDQRYCIGDGSYRFSFKLLPVIGQEE
jgi:beta-galactosidase